MRVNGGEGWGWDGGGDSATPFTSPPSFCCKSVREQQRDDEMKQWLKEKGREDRAREFSVWLKGDSSTSDIVLWMITVISEPGNNIRMTLLHPWHPANAPSYSHLKCYSCSANRALISGSVSEGGSNKCDRKTAPLDRLDYGSRWVALTVVQWRGHRSYWHEWREGWGTVRGGVMGWWQE